MDPLKKQFFEFIKKPGFPCIGAKAAAKKNRIKILIAEDLDSSRDDTKILALLYEFIHQWEQDKDHLQTACVIFKAPLPLSEIQFEHLLWKRLQKLHELDCNLYPWDASVSSNVTDATFSYSIGGKGFFIVGLHPLSSRRARQFNYPTLIFNLHEQFEMIRNHGIFEKMRNKIREADLLYSGSVNPMVKDFGQSTEAIQYSGRQVLSSHKCPFQMQNPANENWTIIKPCSGVSFILKKNDLLVVEDFQGEQVSDLYCFSRGNLNEFLSSGKSIDFNNTLSFSTTNKLYSNKSNVMLSIIRDDVGQHDFLFAPCSKKTFSLMYDNKNPPNGCYEHLIEALRPFNINNDFISTTFNIFMNVQINELNGDLKIEPPKSKKGDKIIFKSHMDLVVGLTACAAPKSNNYSLKPIRYQIIK